MMAMLLEFTHEPVNQSSIPMEITEFVEDLVKKAEEIQEENTQLKKQIHDMKKKLEAEKEMETINRKHKIELLTFNARFLSRREGVCESTFGSHLKTVLLIMFRQLMEKRADRSKGGHCKNCPSLESDLKAVKKRISDLLEEQIVATEKVFDIEQDIKMKKVLEEKKMHEIKEFEQQIEKRKADLSKHFLKTKFRAHWLRQQIKEDLGSKASGDLVFALQKEITDMAINNAFDEIPTKIAAFEETAISEAMNEAKKAIAKKDQGGRISRMNDYYENTKDVRREKYMKWI